MIKRIMLISTIICTMIPAIAFAADSSVARAIFTSGIEDREPVDELSVADTKTTTLKFFTELLNFEGETVIHRWTYNGQMMAVVPFKVKGPRWRVFSSKNIIPEWIGTWAVEVLDGKGTIIASRTLSYTIGENSEASKQIAPPPATETSEDVIRAQFASSIIDREPTDSLSALDTDKEEVFFFCELQGMEDKKITHRWIYNDLIMAEVPLEIGGPRWRVYSSKKMIPAWIGTWRVDIVDDEGNILTSKIIEKTL